MTIEVTIEYVGNVVKCDESVDELWTEVRSAKVKRATRLSQKMAKRNSYATKRTPKGWGKVRMNKGCSRVW